MTTILIGVDGTDRDQDAIAFGYALALAADVPSDEVARVPLEGRSGAHELRAAAERTGAALIVAGSGHAGLRGRLRLGGTAGRLLADAPCPVAVVPPGFDARVLLANPVVGCAYHPGEDGTAALGAAEDLALALEGSLRVMQVVEPPSYLYGAGVLPLSMHQIDEHIHAGTERVLASRIAALSPRLRDVEAMLYSGCPAEVLTTVSETVDLLVVGSRGRGPLASVLLGSVSGRLVRSAACPVIVVPRAARTALGELFNRDGAREREGGTARARGLRASSPATTARRA